MAAGDEETEPSLHDAPVLDEVVIAALVDIDGDGSALRALAELFLRSAPQRVAQLDQAARAGDVDGVRAAAHSLRGTSLTFGATVLGLLMGDIENAARAGAVPDDGLLGAVHRALDEVMAAVRRLHATG